MPLPLNSTISDDTIQENVTSFATALRMTAPGRGRLTAVGLEGDTTIGALTGLSITINAGAAVVYPIGSSFSPDGTREFWGVGVNQPVQGGDQVNIATVPTGNAVAGRIQATYRRGVG